MTTSRPALAQPEPPPELDPWGLEERAPEVVTAGAADWHLTAFLPVNQRVALGRFALKRVPAPLLATVPEDRRGDGPPDGRMEAYDFDADGVPDLVTFSQVMYGPSNGLLAWVRDGATLRFAFGISGEWKELHTDAAGVTLRFEANVLEAGEARFSTVLRYDRRAHRWLGTVKSYQALQGRQPAAGSRPRQAVTVGPATLRITPLASATAPAPPPGSDGYDVSTLLEGNAVAQLPEGSRGLVLGASGAFRFVAFSPLIAATQTSLTHGMNQAVTGTWLCGWVEQQALKLQE